MDQDNNHQAAEQPQQVHTIRSIATTINPPHIQQQTQAQIHQQSTHSSQHQHAQPAAFSMSFGYPQHYLPRHAYPQAPYPANMAYNPNAVPIQYPTSQYGNWPQTPSLNFPPPPAATPSNQEISSIPHVNTNLLTKREKIVATLRNPDTNEEVDLIEIADAELPAKSSAAKTRSTQPSSTETKTNSNTSAKTNAANSVTTLSSNDRTNTDPLSASNILLRKVSEDTDSDKRQAAAITATTEIKTTTTPTTSTTKTIPVTTTATTTTTTSTATAATTAASASAATALATATTATTATATIATTTTTTTTSAPKPASESTLTTTSTSTKATIPPSTARPTTTELTPTVTSTAIKLEEKVETKVNNINGSHRSIDNSQQDVVEKDMEVAEEKPVDGDTPTEKSTVESHDSTEEKGETDEKITLNYEPGQYNPMNNRTGKKKYDKQFLIDVCEKICKLSVFDEGKRDNSMIDYPFQVDPFEPHFSRNVSHLANNRQNDASRRPNHQNYMGRSSAGQERTRKIIAPSSSLTQEVELKTVANPWRPVKEVKEVKEEVSQDVIEVEILKKAFRSILNKLTPNNFDNLALNVTGLNIDTEAKLGEVIDIVFAKALSEPGYCVLYGRMCSHLKKISAGSANFGNTLLKRCQNQFLSDIYSGLNLDERKKKIEEETDPDVKKHMNEELYEEMYRCRMRGLGLIKFIGELYKIGMLNEQIMFDCMMRLLSDTSEESLECLCDLLVTIGEKLDHSSREGNKDEKKASKGASKTNTIQSGRSMASVVSNAQQQQQNAIPEAKTLDDIFDRLHKIRRSKDLPISLRIRFKLLDVCELREKENWQSKKAKDNNPKKLDEIREAHLEKLDNEKNRLSQAPRRNQDGRRHLGHSSGSSSQISSLANESGVNRGGVSNMHGSASSHAIRDHSLDDKMKQNHSDRYEAQQHQQAKTSALTMMTKHLTNPSDSKGLRPMRLGNPNISLRPSATLHNRLSSGSGASDKNTQ